MNLLNVNLQKQDITINFYEGESKSIKDVTREDLLSIMEKIYECPENYRLNKPEELNELKNDLEFGVEGK